MFDRHIDELHTHFTFGSPFLSEPVTWAQIGGWMAHCMDMNSSITIEMRIGKTRIKTECKETQSHKQQTFALQNQYFLAGMGHGSVWDARKRLTDLKFPFKLPEVFQNSYPQKN